MSSWGITYKTSFLSANAKFHHEAESELSFQTWKQIVRGNYFIFSFIWNVITGKIFICRLPCSSDCKESACNVGDLGSIPWSGRSPGEGNGNPLQFSCLENSPGQRSLAGYTPWGHKELDTTKHTPTMGAETAKETEKLKRQAQNRQGAGTRPKSSRCPEWPRGPIRGMWERSATLWGLSTLFFNRWKDRGERLEWAEEWAGREDMDTSTTSPF